MLVSLFYGNNYKVCKIKMTVDTMVLDKVMLIPDQLWMYDKEESKSLFKNLRKEDKDLIMFTIESLDLVYRNMSRPQKGIMMRVVLKRKPTMELMTTYLPTLLLLILTLSGSFFRVEIFGDTMAHNLTIMLVMTTIFTSKIEELPPTSDTKMIDIWLIGCLLVPFTEVVLRTMIEVQGNCDHCNGSEENKTSTSNKRIDPSRDVNTSHEVPLEGVAQIMVETVVSLLCKKYIFIVWI